MKDLTKQIIDIKKKACDEAEKVANLVLAKYSDKIIKLVQKYMPAGSKIIIGNGCAWLEDKDGNEIATGRGWGHETNRKDDDATMECLGILQYTLDYRDVRIAFDIPNEIKSLK